MLHDAARLFAAPMAAEFLGRPGGAVLRGLGANAGDLEVTAIVDRLRSEPIETSQGMLADRQWTTLHVERSKLPDGTDWIRDDLAVEVPSYPGADFVLIPGQCDDSDAMAKLVVARKPLRRGKDARRRGGN